MNKTCRKGFTLIEIVVVMLISAIMTFGLYRMFRQTSKTVSDIIRIIDIDLPIMPFYNQIEMDISGMFFPKSTLDYYIDLIKKKEQKNLKNNDIQKETKETSIKTDIVTEQKTEMQNKKTNNIITNIFYIKNTQSQFILSFITTAGIKTLEYDGSIRPESFTRRVAYIFKKDNNTKNTYKIIYKTDAISSLLEVDNIEKEHTTSYELISGLKDIKIKFTVYQFTENKDKNKSDKENKKDVTLTEWDEENIFEKYKTLIPAYITISGILVEQNGKEHSFNFEFKVPAYRPYLQVEKPNVIQNTILKALVKNNI